MRDLQYRLAELPDSTKVKVGRELGYKKPSCVDVSSGGQSGEQSGKLEQARVELTYPSKDERSLTDDELFEKNMQKATGLSYA